MRHTVQFIDRETQDCYVVVSEFTPRGKAFKIVKQSKNSTKPYEMDIEVIEHSEYSTDQKPLDISTEKFNEIVNRAVVHIAENIAGYEYARKKDVEENLSQKDH